MNTCQAHAPCVCTPSASPSQASERGTYLFVPCVNSSCSHRHAWLVNFTQKAAAAVSSDWYHGSQGNCVPSKWCTPSCRFQRVRIAAGAGTGTWQIQIWAPRSCLFASAAMRMHRPTPACVWVHGACALEVSTEPGLRLRACQAAVPEEASWTKTT